MDWKPKSWGSSHRFVFIRKTVRQQHKEPLQLDLFIPYEYGYEFKVVLTNKRLTAAKVVAFHNGRGSQEGIFGELKTHNQLDYVPTRTWRGNQVYLLSVLLSHNLTREMQMIARVAERTTQKKRPALWEFEQLNTFRRRIIERAGRVIRPNGCLTLSISANDEIKNQLLQYLEAFDEAA